MQSQAEVLGVLGGMIQPTGAVDPWIRLFIWEVWGGGSTLIRTSDQMLGNLPAITPRSWWVRIPPRCKEHSKPQLAELCFCVFERR